jgi:hypothetical protein
MLGVVAGSQKPSISGLHALLRADARRALQGEAENLEEEVPRKIERLDASA